MTPEELVPTLETCIKLKEAGYVQNAYFAWMREAEEKRFNRNVSEGWDALDYIMYARNEPISEIVAAPTLQEVLEELPESYSVGFFQMWKYKGYTVGYVDDMEVFIKPFNHHNPSEVAALLWLELHK